MIELLDFNQDINTFTVAVSALLAAGLGISVTIYGWGKIKNYFGTFGKFGSNNRDFSDPGWRKNQRQYGKDESKWDVF